MISKKLALSIIVGLLVSAFFLFLAFRQIEIKEVGRILVQINILYLLPLLPISLVIAILRALRWQVLLKSVKVISVPSLFSSTMIGFMINHTLPLRIGEFARAFSLSRKEGLSTVECFGTIITERVFDLLALFVILVPLLLVPTVSHQLGDAGMLLFIVLILFFIFFVFIYRYGLIIIEHKKIISFLPKKLIPILFNLIKGLQSLKNWRDLSNVILLSFISWFAAGVLFYAFLPAFHVTHLPLWSGMVILVFISFGVALPSSPGYIGTYHYFAMLSLELFGIDREIALGFSITTHLLQTLFFVGTGLICLFFEGLKFSDTITQSRKLASTHSLNGFPS